MGHFPLQLLFKDNGESKLAAPQIQYNRSGTLSSFLVTTGDRNQPKNSAHNELTEIISVQNAIENVNEWRDEAEDVRT